MKGEGEQDGEPKTVHRKDVPANSRATLHRFRLGPDAANNASASRKKESKRNPMPLENEFGQALLFFTAPHRAATHGYSSQVLDIRRDRPGEPSPHRSYH
jgi:hypothetical protein